MAPEAKISAYISSFISRSVPSSSPKKVKSAGGEGDLATLCRNLVSAAGPTASNVLYGEEVRSQVDEWLSFATAAEADRDPVSFSARLRTLDSYILTRAVMLGNGTTVGLADIALFVSLHDQLAALPTVERNSYPNLLRWIDYVQNKDDVSHAYEWIPIVKPKFNPPVSSVEPDPKKVAETITKSQHILEDKGGPDPLPATKGASQTDATKVQEKERKGRSEALQAGKVDLADDAKKVPQKGKKEPAPIQKDAFGLEILDIKVGIIKTVKKHPTAETQSAFGLEILDIKVGIIKTVKKHPTAETLYVEEIDIGEGSLRQVVSGLAKYLTEDQMLNRQVLVLSNVKPSKLRDVLSSGLVLCTSNDDHSQCEPVIPPKEAIVGERVTVAGYEGKPEAVLNPKKKQWDKLYPDLHTNDTGVACYKGIPLTTSAGPCTSSIIKGTIK